MQNAELGLRTLVDQMVESYHQHDDIIKLGNVSQINKNTVLEMIETMRCLIFPGFFGEKKVKYESMEYYIGELLENLSYNLEKQVTRALRLENDDELKTLVDAREITADFMERLPGIRAILATDVDASHEGDPAAYSKEEIILSYPSIYTIMVNRIAHELYLLKVPLLPRMMTEHAHSLTGIDIHPGATLGHHFFIDHGTGIVIGETTEIGNYVKIYQGVTLGALSTRGGQSLRHTKRHPTIENGVTIYSGASIFGGTTVIGEAAVIGSNAFITKSIPQGARVSIKNEEFRFANDGSDFSI